jgi:Xaa-Pro aminopeptidase
MKPVSAKSAMPATPKVNSYDLTPPSDLLEFMVQGWKAPSGKVPPKIAGHARFHARRRALSKLFPGETLVIPTGHEKVRSNDTTYRFRPSTDFYYFTGNTEPDCCLVMLPESGGGHRDVLFVEPNPGKSDSTFFTDRNKGELWVGPRLGVPQSAARFGVHEARGLSELSPMVKSLSDGKTTKPWRLLRGIDAALDGLVPAQQERDKAFGIASSEMRLIKDSLEISELKKAIDSTQRGFEDVIRALPDSTTERWVEGIFNLRARVEGNDVGYGTIAAAGHHACTLHWVKNDGDLKKGDLLLLDAGVEADTLYTADITRTLPISGKFSKEQREIYELVLEAQRVAFAACKPGNDFLEPNRVAMEVLARGLEKLGILPMSADEALREEKQFYKRYSLHNVSHMLGLDVHDCAQARMEVYKFGKLRAGMVLTVEPGLYFQLDDLTVPAKYRGIGVRIEDDVVITARGCDILSDGIPRETRAVEQWMAKLKGTRGKK